MKHSIKSKSEEKVRAILQQFRRDSKMSRSQWDSFCKRYATRNISTVIQMLTEEYGTLPINARALIQKELQTEVKKTFIYNACFCENSTLYNK